MYIQFTFSAQNVALSKTMTVKNSELPAKKQIGIFRNYIMLLLVYMSWFFETGLEINKPRAILAKLNFHS